MDVTIDDYQPTHQEAFRRLNEEWISTYFEMEEADREVLDHPQEYIIDRGGFIFVASLDGEPVGVCALLKRDDIDAYELAKMAVSPKAQGKNIGFLLGQTAINKAASQKSPRVYLESNTQLVPAIRLYEKLGFKTIVGPPTPYERVDIQMELKLDCDCGRRSLPVTTTALTKESNMFTVWLTEGGTRLAEREWPIVPRVGETITLNDSSGLFEVIRVHWEEHGEAVNGLVAHVSLRTAGS